MLSQTLKEVNVRYFKPLTENSMTATKCHLP